MEDRHDAACGPWLGSHKRKILAHAKPRSTVLSWGPAATRPADTQHRPPPLLPST
jgi:hypothetical protein